MSIATVRSQSWAPNVWVNCGSTVEMTSVRPLACGLKWNLVCCNPPSVHSAIVHVSLCHSPPWPNMIRPWSYPPSTGCDAAHQNRSHCAPSWYQCHAHHWYGLLATTSTSGHKSIEMNRDEPTNDKTTGIGGDIKWLSVDIYINR